MTDDPLVRFDRADAVATITLDSPANRNALSARLRRELLTHLDAAIADPAVRVIVLTHTGPVFCSGMDLKESAGAAAGDQGVNELPRILADPVVLTHAGGRADWPARPGRWDRHGRRL